MRLNIRGQSVFEYIILAVTVLLVMAFFLPTTGMFGQKLESTVVNGTLSQLNSVTDDISFPP